MGQWASHRSFVLILNIWIPQVGSVLLLYLLILLIKEGLRPIIIFKVFVERVGYMPLGSQCNHTVVIINQSNAAMLF